MSKLCVSGGMEEWQCSDLVTSLFKYASSREESASDDALMHNLTSNVETLSDCLSPLFDVTEAAEDESDGTDIVRGTLSLAL